MKSLDSEKVELLNDYFADIGEDLAKNFVERVNGDDNSYISRITPICKEIQTDVKLLNQQIDTLKVEKSMGDDNIAAKELKIAGQSAALGLTRVIDKILQDRKYPKQWKKARLKSVFKKGLKTELGNYRPISLLSIPGKILEGQISKNLDDHMESNSALTTSQWGFRKGRSTEGLLLHMTETWKQALDEGLIVGVLLIDFRKAFNTINHKILEKKLQGCSVAGQMFDILCDYLKDRTQYVQLNGIKSKTRVIVYGVPQCSLLGPRLFTIYINDLPDYINQRYVFLFADDTTFYYVGHDIEEVIDMLNNIGGQVSEWCKRNQLTIHTGKSEAMIVTRQDFIGPVCDLL